MANENTIIGLIDDICRPKVLANGKEILAVEIESRIGDMPHCSIRAQIEKFGEFGEPGDEVKVTAETKEWGGVVFKGIINGHSISHDNGNIVYRIDLIHKNAFDLDSSSVFVPGFMPGNAVDSETVIKLQRNTSMEGGMPTAIYEVKPGNFGANIIQLLKDHTQNWKAISPADNDMNNPKQIEIVLQALNKIESWTGEWASGEQALIGVSNDFSAQLKSGSTSSTYWNFLSKFISQYDLCLFCNLLDDTMAIMPVFCGIEADRIRIDASTVSSLSHSNRYTRTPERIIVMNTDVSPVIKQGTQPQTTKIGEYKIKYPEKGASGVTSVEMPDYLKYMSVSSHVADPIGKYAEMIAARTIGSTNIVNVTTVWMPLAVPGVPVSLDYEGLLRPYHLDKINIKLEYHGYCTSVRHMITTDQPPTTSLSFSHATRDGKHKMKKHPIWPEGDYYIRWSDED